MKETFAALLATLSVATAVAHAEETAAAPVRVLYAKGGVVSPDGLLRAGDGRSCVLSWDGEGRRPVLALDFGEGTVGGYAAFGVTAFAGDPAPVLRLAYATHPAGLTPTGCCTREKGADYLGKDVDLPVLPANRNRHEIYSVGRTGVFVAPLLQGQERYVRVQLDTPGRVEIDFVEIVNAGVHSEESVKGSFRCSDRCMNDAWAASAQTCRLAAIPDHNAWKGVKGRLLPRELAWAKSDGWCRTPAPCDGTLRVEYEFDANPHFPKGVLEILAGDRRVRVEQDATNVLKTAEVAIRKGERFGFAAPKESWPVIHAAWIGDAWRADFSDLSGWEFATTPPFLADGGKRDRLPWTGDMWWAERNMFYAFGPQSPYVASTLRIMAANRTPEGYVHACPWPERRTPPASGDYGPFPSDEFAAWLVPSVWDCYFFTADESLLRDTWPAVAGVIGYLKRFFREDGIFEQRRETCLGSGGLAFGGRSLYHRAYVNIILWMAFRDGARIAEALGRGAEAAAWRADAARLAASIRKTFWDEDKECLIDSLEWPYVGLHAMSLALSALFATDAEAATMSPYLYRIGHGKMQALIARGKFEYGDSPGGYEAIAAHSWYKEVEPGWPGAHTFTECMDIIHDNYGDESHPDVAIAHLFSAYTLGVAPEEPGFAKFSFRPQPGELTFAEGIVPTPHGDIHARWDKAASGGIKAAIVVPVGTTCEFAYGATRRTLGPGRHELFAVE